MSNNKRPLKELVRRAKLPLVFSTCIWLIGIGLAVMLIGVGWRMYVWQQYLKTWPVRMGILSEEGIWLVSFQPEREDRLVRLWGLKLDPEIQVKRLGEGGEWRMGSLQAILQTNFRDEEWVKAVLMDTTGVSVQALVSAQYLANDTSEGQLEMIRDVWWQALWQEPEKEMWMWLWFNSFSVQLANTAWHDVQESRSMVQTEDEYAGVHLNRAMLQRWLQQRGFWWQPVGDMQSVVVVNTTEVAGKAELASDLLRIDGFQVVGQITNLEEKPGLVVDSKEMLVSDYVERITEVFAVDEIRVDEKLTSQLRSDLVLLLR